MSCAKHSRLYCEVCFPSGIEPQAHPGIQWQQKGEKMPTFEGQPVIFMDMYRYWHNKWHGKAEIAACAQWPCPDVREYLSGPPAASEERGLREIVSDIRKMKVTGEPEIVDAVTKGFNWIADRIEGALQSVPSSPLPAIKLATYLLAKLPSHWQYDEVRTMAKEVVTAEPSDAGQPRCTTCWALLPCKVHQPQPRTCQEEQD